MKISNSITRHKRFFLTCLLFMFILPIFGQDSIVAYSDTTTILESEQHFTDSLWNQAYQPTPHSHLFEWIQDLEDLGPLDFLLHFMGINVILFLLVFFALIFIPLIGIAFFAFFLYRYFHPKEAGKTSSVQPLEIKREQLLEKAIRRGCWGGGLIVVEAIFQISSLLYLAGIILLFTAAANWLYTRIHHK